MGLAERYGSVLERIAAAAKSSGRTASDVELVVITKMHSVAVPQELYRLGQRVFGENKDQEAGPKARELKELGASDAIWHFVGQLQTNKVKTVLDYASCIHSIDRPSLVKELGKQLEKREQQISGFLELNLTDDPGRGGVAPDQLLALAESVLETGRVQILGVMAVAGLDVDPRLDFERALTSSNQLLGLVPQAKGLSIGMSEDFEVAIEMGATHVRIGSAITGPRPSST
jgi:pyridoxal phosphate enzyme (YggS family)